MTKAEEEWKAMGEIGEVRSDKQTDQLDTLRHKMKSQIIIYQVRKAK